MIKTCGTELSSFIQLPFKRFHATKKIMRAPYPSRLAVTLVAGTLIFSPGYVTSSQTTRTIKIIVSLHCRRRV